MGDDDAAQVHALGSGRIAVAPESGGPGQVGMHRLPVLGDGQVVDVRHPAREMPRGLGGQRDVLPDLVGAAGPSPGRPTTNLRTRGLYANLPLGTVGFDTAATGRNGPKPANFAETPPAAAISRNSRRLISLLMAHPPLSKPPPARSFPGDMISVALPSYSRGARRSFGPSGEA